MKRSEAKKALKSKTPAELSTELAALYREQFGLRMQKATQQLTNHTQLGNTRRDIARAKTILNEKKRQQQQGAGK